MTPQPGLSNSPYFVSPTPLFRLEHEHPEEEAIHEFDRQIDDARRRGESLDHLIRERNEQLEAWEKRLKKEIADKKNRDRIDYLNGTLERVKRDYGKRKPEAG